MHAVGSAVSCKSFLPVQRAAPRCSPHLQGQRRQHALPAPPAARSSCRPQQRQATCRRKVAGPPAAARAGAAGRQQPADGQQLWSEVQQLAQQAQKLEQQGGADEAAELPEEGVARLEQQHGRDFSLSLLHQALWHLHFSAGRHQQALLQAVRVADAVAEQYGKDSAELQLVSVRLGMSTAACGRVEAGLELIYGATPVVQHNLGLLLDQAAELAGAEEEPSAAAAANLQDTIDKLATALGEGNLYGGIYTMQHAVSKGLQAGVVRGWEELEEIVVSGFGSLMAAAGADGGTVDSALRDHDRLLEQLGTDPLLARLLRAQNQRLHEMAEQGLDHPSFHSD